MNRIFVLSMGLLVVFASCLGAGVVWSPKNGIVICNVSSNQLSPVITSDGNGGAIIAWCDFRNGGYDVYAQRVDKDGNVKWTSNGKNICNTYPEQMFLKIISDGSGGAIIAWQDVINGFTNYESVKVQRVDANGNVKWTQNGVSVSNTSNDRLYPEIASDGAGGVLVAFMDNYHIYAQRVDSNGNVKWQADGVVVCDATGNQYSPLITSDGNGGAIITWQDYRNMATTAIDIYAQRIDGNGSVKWTANGVAIATATSNQTTTSIVSDGSSGAIILWRELKNYSSTGIDVYAQRVDADGNIKWQANGISVCSAAGNQENSKIINSDSGSVIVVWEDTRNATDSSNIDIYVQRLDLSGNIKWQLDGVPISTISGLKQNPTITSDKKGGAIITWQDDRNLNGSDIYAQRIDVDGNAKWDLNGIVICSSPNTQNTPVIASDDSEGAIIAWADLRTATSYDIYAQRVSGTEEISQQTSLEKVSAYPNPFKPGSNAKVNFINLTEGASVKIYTISGEIVGEVIVDVLGIASWDGKTGNGNYVASGIYLAYMNDGSSKKLIKILIER